MYQAIKPKRPRSEEIIEGQRAKSYHSEDASLSFAEHLRLKDRLSLQPPSLERWSELVSDQDRSDDIIYEALEGRYFLSDPGDQEFKIWILGDDVAGWALAVHGKYKNVHLTVTDVKLTHVQPSATQFDLIVIQNPERWVSNVDDLLGLVTGSLKSSGTIEVQGLGSCKFEKSKKVMVAWESIQECFSGYLHRQTTEECSTWQLHLSKMFQTSSRTIPVKIAIPVKIDRENDFKGLLNPDYADSPRRKWLSTLLGGLRRAQLPDAVGPAQTILLNDPVDGTIDFFVCEGRPKLPGQHVCHCCPRRPRRFDDLAALRAHEHEKPFICEGACTRRYRAHSELNRHREETHIKNHEWSCAHITSWEQTLTDDGKCGFCGKQGVDETHVQEEHRFGVCGRKRFHRFHRHDNFRQHTYHVHRGRHGPWTAALVTAGTSPNNSGS